MTRLQRIFLLSILSWLLFIISCEGKINHDWTIKLNRSCTLSLYENDDTSSDYKKLAADVRNGVTAMLKGGSSFLSASLNVFNCVGEHMEVGMVVLSKNKTNANISEFQMTFTRAVELRNTTFTKSIITYNLTVPPLLKRKPVLYARLDGSISARHFCKYRSSFKENVAQTLILADGFTRARSSQVILNHHPCGKQDNLLHDLQFYVSQDGLIGEPDVNLTTLAYRVIHQMIYDGTAWKLGVHLEKYLDKIALLGIAKVPVSELTDFEITYTGFGAVLLLIIVVIFIVELMMVTRECCCQKCCGLYEYDFHVDVKVSRTSTNDKVENNNEVFEGQNVTLSRASQTENEYVELGNIKPADGSVAPQMTTFQDKIRNTFNGDTSIL